jgi:mRNA-degrading endonuclease RelE of RelBE toxin-antitoxin system
MELIFSEQSEKELEQMNKQLNSMFGKHFEKISLIPPRRHMRFGLPFSVEEVTKQARIIYKIENETICILRCFVTHKEYEKWYKSYK